MSVGWNPKFLLRCAKQTIDIMLIICFVFVDQRKVQLKHDLFKIRKYNFLMVNSNCECVYTTYICYVIYVIHIYVFKINCKPSMPKISVIRLQMNSEYLR